MNFLLDVNVLIALIDPYHNFHDIAHDWLTAESDRQWATCPITENGAVRILGHHQYPQGPGTPAAAAQLVKGLLAHPGRRFWPDDFSLLDSEIVDCSRLSTAAQVTDAYLLALAVKNESRLATFDRRLSLASVDGGAEALHVIA